MEKPKCRICLTIDLPLVILAQKHLQDTYEELTAMPFKTDDNRPTQVCYICLAKLNNCYKLRMACLQSEKYFTTISSGNTTKTKEKVKKIYKLEIIPVVHLTLGCIDKQTLPDIKKEVLEINEKCNETDTTFNSSPNVQIKTEAPEIDTLGSNSYVNTVVKSPQECSIKTEITKDAPDAMETDNGGTAKVVLQENFIEIKDEIDSENINIENHNSMSDKLTFIDDSDNDMECDMNINLPVKHAKPTYVKNIYKHDANVTNVKKGDYQCDICTNGFSTIGILKRHVQKKHVSYKCKTCKENFKCIDHFYVHMHDHDNKSFFCKICNRKFSFKIQLDQHLKLHAANNITHVIIKD